MMIPTQNISEDKKDKVWAINTVRSIVYSCGTTEGAKKKDILCFKMYNGDFNESDYDYLTKSGDYSYPAKVRWIPYVRPKLENLRSRKQRRIFNFSVYVSDVDSLKRKSDYAAHKMLSIIDAEIERRYMEVDMALMELQQKQQSMAQLMQQQPQSEEEAQQLQQLQQTVPFVLKQYEYIQKRLEKEGAFIQEDLDKINRYFKYDFRDIKEEYTQKILSHYRKELNIHYESLRSFTYSLITGKPMFYVDMKSSWKEPVFKAISPVKVYWSADGENRWIQDGTWVAIEEYMSATDCITEFRDDLKENSEAYEMLLQYESNYSSYSGMLSTVDGSAYFSEETGIYTGTNTVVNGIKVWRVFWRSPRRINIKKKQDKYNANREISMIISDEELDKKLLRKGERIEYRYVDDLYEGIMINNYVIRVEKRTDAIRSKDNLSKVYLPVFGKTFNTIDERPYSLVWNTKDIQVLLNIVHYHQELMLALAGVKGFIMDKSQVPDGMSPKEWMYQRKLGVAWIETYKKGRQTPISFNQFQSFDDTLSPSIQYLSSIIQVLDDMIGNITGVNRQAMGEVVASDQVKTFQLSRESSVLTTEIIFNEHDEVERKALSHLVNLVTKFKYKNGGVLNVINDDLSSILLNIPKNLLNESDYEVHILNNGKEQYDLEQMKQIASTMKQQGLLNMTQLISLYRTDSLMAMEKKLEQYEQKALELKEKQMQSEFQNNKALEEERIKLENDYKVTIAEQENKIKNILAQIEQAKYQLEAQQFEWEKQFKEKELTVNTALKKYELESENVVELNYLKEQQRASKVSETLSAMELQLEALLGEKDIEVKKEQAKSKNNKKEHISDR